MKIVGAIVGAASSSMLNCLRCYRGAGFGTVDLKTDSSEQQHGLVVLLAFSRFWNLSFRRCSVCPSVVCPS
jgi:hypothetical protein